MPEPTETPNVVVEDPDDRRKWGKVLYIVSVATAAVSITVAVFPELASFGIDIDRFVILGNALVSLVSGAFGLGVTLPNIPRR
jgi:hypothetical protein